MLNHQACRAVQTATKATRAVLQSCRVEKCSVAEIMEDPAFPDLVEEYAAESATIGLPSPNAKLENYRRIEAGGMLHAFRALDDEELTGFLVMLAPPLLHFSAVVAVTESFFVAKAHRQSMAGLKLLAAAETEAAALGSPGLLVSAPTGSKLAEMLPKCGFHETSRVFFKKVTTDE